MQNPSFGNLRREASLRSARSVTLGFQQLSAQALRQRSAPAIKGISTLLWLFCEAGDSAQAALDRLVCFSGDAECYCEIEGQLIENIRQLCSVQIRRGALLASFDPQCLVRAWGARRNLPSRVKTTVRHVRAIIQQSLESTVLPVVTWDFQ